MPESAVYVMEKMAHGFRRLGRDAGAGFYESPGWNRRYPKLQILTVEALLAGVERLERPPTAITFKQAQRDQAEGAQQGGFGFK